MSASGCVQHKTTHDDCVGCLRWALEMERKLTQELRSRATGIVNALSSREARELMHRDASFADRYKTLRAAVSMRPATCRAIEVTGAHCQVPVDGGRLWCDYHRGEPPAPLDAPTVTDKPKVSDVEQWLLDDPFILCGQEGKLFSGGCGKRIDWKKEVYRCADCGVPYHRDCLRQHCKDDLATAERERDEARRWHEEQVSTTARIVEDRSRVEVARRALEQQITQRDRRIAARDKVLDELGIDLPQWARDIIEAADRAAPAQPAIDPLIAHETARGRWPMSSPKWDDAQPATKGLWDANTCGRLCDFECGGICDMTPGHEGKHHCGTRYAPPSPAATKEHCPRRLMGETVPPHMPCDTGDFSRDAPSPAAREATTCGYPDNGSWPVEHGGMHTGKDDCPCDAEPHGEFKVAAPSSPAAIEATTMSQSMAKRIATMKGEDLPCPECKQHVGWPGVLHMQPCSLDNSSTHEAVERVLQAAKFVVRKAKLSFAVDRRREVPESAYVELLEAVDALDAARSTKETK